MTIVVAAAVADGDDNDRMIKDVVVVPFVALVAAEATASILPSPPIQPNWMAVTHISKKKTMNYLIR